ncbi:MAG TPA: CHAT domain-containing protein, partial [Thermoanaerobaculia bacterium]|nr:CHAT domain-containing protein [Thermoanaerobaculia bacterium]
RVGGEGLVGLSRAFFYAGTPSLIVSLWQVEDRSTARLMRDFYQRLRGGESKGEALREAKLALLRSGDSQPFFWAPFVLLGLPQ